MGIAAPLSPTLVRQITTEEELPFRARKVKRQDAEIILRYGRIVGSSIEHHPTLERGMDRARILIRQHEDENRSFPSGTVIIADEMTGSMGRFQRPWHAPRGGLWLTLIMVNTLTPDSNRLYPLAAGAACCELLRDYDLDAYVKWVNDVHINGKKIAGILTESMTGPKSGEEYILIGLGINVNNDTFPSELSEIATSMKAFLGGATDMPLLAARLLAKLTWNIGLLHFEEQLSFDEQNGERQHLLIENWLQMSDMVGQKVLFGFDVQKEPQFTATVKGLDRSGGLILELPDGNTIVENSGEIIYIEN